MHRKVNVHFVTFNIKTVPAGDILAVVLDPSDATVDTLYELFRANSSDGLRQEAHLYLPTNQGIFSLCVEDDQETELLRANINAFEPLATYNIGTGRLRGFRGEASVTVLQYPLFAPVEASDAWVRRGKPGFDTLARYIESLFDSGEEKPCTTMRYSTKVAWVCSLTHSRTSLTCLCRAPPSLSAPFKQSLCLGAAAGRARPPAPDRVAAR